MKPSQLKTGQGKLFTEHQVTQLIRLYEAKIRSMQQEIQTMKTRKAPVKVFQTFDAPDTGRLVIEEQKKRGMR